MSNNIIQLIEEAVKDDIKELVRKSVEKTLNDLPDKEAEELTCAARYERNEARQSIERQIPHVYVDGIYLKRNWVGELLCQLLQLGLVRGGSFGGYKFLFHRFPDLLLLVCGQLNAELLKEFNKFVHC